MRATPILVALVALLLTSVAHGEAPALPELAAAIDRAATEPDGDRVVVGHISRTLAVSAETLRTDRARTGLGWGDLLIAYRLSHEGDLPFEEIVADVRGGKAWPAIVGDHMDLATLVAEVDRSREMIERRSEDKGPAVGRAPARSGGGTGRGGRRR